MTAFYVLGGVLAAWALVLTALGITRHDFPAPGAAERVVVAISVLLVAGAIGSGIVTAASQEEEPGAGEAEAEAAESAEAGGGEPAEGGDGQPAGALTIAADPGGQLAFDTTSLETEPGEVTITMDNPSSVPHNVALEGQGVDEEGEVVGQGEQSQVSAQLEPGEYTFYCSVPGHRQGGMEGTLQVSG